MTDSLSNRSAFDDPPNFDLESTRARTIRFGTPKRYAPTYRAIRLSEVAALPPASPKAYPGRATASGLFRLAADQLAMTNPELAVRLVLRSCTSNSDETLSVSYHVLAWRFWRMRQFGGWLQTAGGQPTAAFRKDGLSA